MATIGRRGEGVAGDRRSRAERAAAPAAPDVGIGMRLLPITAATRRVLELDPETEGAVVGAVTPGGRAVLAGLRVGDVILAVAGDPVDGPSAVLARINDECERGEDHVLLHLDRGRLQRSSRFRWTLPDVRCETESGRDARRGLADRFEVG